MEGTADFSLLPASFPASSGNIPVMPSVISIEYQSALFSCTDMRDTKRPDCTGATITVVASGNPADFVHEQGELV